MLVPYYMYGKQPEYVILGGFVFQTLTRDYLSMWGDKWAGKVPPHLYYYYSEKSFCPTADRQDIVVLNYVLPTNSNLGYQQLARLVVRAVDGKPVCSMKDLLGASESKNKGEYMVIEFEMDAPKLILNRQTLEMENRMVAQMYGIPKLYHVE